VLVAASDAVAAVTGERRGCKTGEGRWKCGQWRATALAAAVAATAKGSGKQRACGSASGRACYCCCVTT
jgi:hypothetical protein